MVCHVINYFDLSRSSFKATDGYCVALCFRNKRARSISTRSFRLARTWKKTAVPLSPIVSRTKNDLFTGSALPRSTRSRINSHCKKSFALVVQNVTDALYYTIIYVPYRTRACQRWTVRTTDDTILAFVFPLTIWSRTVAYLILFIVRKRIFLDEIVRVTRCFGVAEECIMYTYTRVQSSATTHRR